MATFSFTARNEAGMPTNGTLVAASIAEAGQMLRADGKYPISLKPADQLGGGGVMSGRGVSVSRADIIQFSTQLAIMVETGMVLTEALDCIAQQATKPNIKRLVEDLSTHVQGGGEFSAALSRHPRSFPRLYVALIRAAEKSGMMSKLLYRALNYLRDEADTVRRIRGALTYPGIMFAFALSTTIFLLAFVLPRFTVIYANKGAALPAPTKVLMTISDFLVGNWMVLLGGTVGSMVLGWFYINTRGGKSIWHFVQLHLPLLGPIFRKVHLSRGMRMIGTMASSGINLVDCVATANDLCGNVHYQRMWSDVGARITVGKPMAEAMASNALVPRSIAQMIHSGERGGKLAHVMEQVANYSEQELKEKIADLTRYIEPAMIVIMGGLIGGVALALMLPIFTISRVVAH